MAIASGPRGRSSAARRCSSRHTAAHRPPASTTSTSVETTGKGARGRRGRSLKPTPGWPGTSATAIAGAMTDASLGNTGTPSPRVHRVWETWRSPPSQACSLPERRRQTASPDALSRTAGACRQPSPLGSIGPRRARLEGEPGGTAIPPRHPSFPGKKGPNCFPPPLRVSQYARPPPVAYHGSSRPRTHSLKHSPGGSRSPVPP